MVMSQATKTRKLQLYDNNFEQNKRKTYDIK